MSDTIGGCVTCSGRGVWMDELCADCISTVLARAHSLLSEIYEPAGVLIYWSSRIKYLDNRRPCDLYRDRDVEALTQMCNRLDADTLPTPRSSCE